MSTATMAKPARRTGRLHGTASSSPGPAGAHSLGERLSVRDDSVIVDLHRIYSGRILGLAIRILQDRQLAEEAVQETLLRVWRRAESFDPTRELEPWLFRIARNTTYDLARARSCRPRAQFGDPEPVLGSIPETDAAGDPAASLAALTLQWEVRGALDELPVIEREVVRLQHLVGLTHREIAERLDVSIGTVKSRSHRAHARLAAVLRARRAETDADAAA